MAETATLPTSTAAPGTSTTTSEPTAATTAPGGTSEVTYDLKLPADLSADEKGLFDSGYVERTVALSRARGLSNDAAQQVLDFAVTEQRSAISKANKAVSDRVAAEQQQREAKAIHEAEQQRQQWQQTIGNDPFFGKDEAERHRSLEVATQAVDKYFGPEVKEWLNQTGLSGHPLLYKALVKIGRASAESPLVFGTTSVASPKSAAEIMYPKNTAA